MPLPALLPLPLLLAAAPAAPVPAAPTLVIERTLLKAAPGKREALARFIVANWFAMDRIAVSQRLFTGYRLYENAAGADAAWDLAVEVGYPNPAGYDDSAVQARFAAIRAAHRTVPIDGQVLADLGRIIGSERLRPREGS